MTSVVLLVLAILAIVVLVKAGREGYEDIMYPGHPAYFFDVDERGNPWRQRPTKPYGGPGPETVVVDDWN
jgi:hypothetical protein